MKLRPERSRLSTAELIVVLFAGLFVGAAVAAFVLLAAWVVFRQASPPPSIVITFQPPSPQPTFTPLPTIPVQTIPVESVAGGTVSTTSGGIKFTLASGATIFVGQDSEVELTQLPAAEAATRRTVLTLLKGRLLVSVVLQPDETFIVRTPTQDFAQVTGSVMGVEYDPALQTFRVDCLEGHCRIGRDADAPTGVVDLTGDQSSIQSQGNAPAVFNESRNAEWIALGGEVVPPPPTPTPLPTPNQAELCATFRAQFPGTPCP